MFNDGNNGFTMPVMPFNGGGSNGNGDGFFGGEGIWALLVILLLFGNNGWGGGFGGGFGGGDGILYPWLNNSQNINSGFRDQMIDSSINSIQNSVTSGFGDVQLGIAGVNQNICQTGNSVVSAITSAQSALSGQMYANTIADMERSFASQTANTAGMTALQSQLAQNGFSNASSMADLKYTVATENCADRTAAAQNTRDIIDSQTRGTQAILDKLCALELDGVKGQLAQAQRENVGLQNQLNMATMRESQAAQNAFIADEINQQNEVFYNRLKSCPVPSMPVYGNAPIFTCNQNQNCGCGCNNGF